MSVPTRRILEPLFGQPVLRAANNGAAIWAELATLHKGGGWQARLTGGVQDGDDWAAIFVPVSELRVTDFNAATWSYSMTSTQTMGINIVIWVHNPDDFSKRAEITQLGNVSGLGKAEGSNSHTLDKTTDQFFFYGENTTGTGLTKGPTNLYGWDDFQADVLFKTWTIYRISLEYGWEASGTFSHVWVKELNLNGMQIPLKPGLDEVLTRVDEVTSAVEDVTTAVGNIKTGTVITTPTATATDITGANTTEVALASNANRVYALIVNNSDTKMYIELGTAAVDNEGIPLAANGGYYEITGLNLYTGAINIICASADKRYLVTEGV